MEPRTLVFGLAALIVVGACGLIVNSFAVESAKNDLRLAKSQLTSERNALEAAKESFASSESKLRDLHTRKAEAQGSNGSVEDTEDSIRKLQKQVDALKEKWSAQAQLMDAAIRQARNDALDKVIPEITLKVGNSLTDCTVNGFKDEMLSVIHSTGTARLTAAQLPPALQDRYRLGWKLVPPFSDQDASNGKNSTVAASEKLPEALPDPSSEEPEPAKPGPPRNQRLINEKVAAVATLRAKIGILESQRRDQLEAAAEARRKYNSARIQGRASSQSAIEDAAQRAAKGIQDQMDRTQADISRLEREIVELRLQ